jgi:hypothetical protein
LASLYYKIFSLFPKSSVNARHDFETEPKALQGLNLKLVHNNENLYTTIMPHPSLGDPSVESVIESLQSNLPYVCLENLKEEYRLKKSEKYFLDFMNHELKSHATIQKSNFVEEDIKVALGFYKSGFKRIKFKMNPQFFKDQEYYFDFLNKHSDVEFIFDFNSSAKYSELKDLNWSKDILDQVYWEDPIDTKDIESLKLLKQMGFQLILDQKDMLHHQRLKPLANIFDVVAVKPTKESVHEILKVFPKSKLLITTNMGDELDHVISAYWANYIFTQHSDRYFGSGLYTRHFFKSEDLFVIPIHSTPFSRRNRELDPKVRSSFLNFENTGILRGWGLDLEMQRLDWIYVKDIDVDF